MKFENTEVWGFEAAIRGARNPMNSWSKLDSKWICDELNQVHYDIGDNDMKLATKLIKAGTEHRKFLRMIHVQVDITAPRYFWSEYDTYKVATTANSTSTMHKLLNNPNPITEDMFSYNKLDSGYIYSVVEKLEQLRQEYLITKDDELLHRAKQILPEGFLQMRTVDLNYETLKAMCSKGQRRSHRLPEWRVDFINWARSLPYAQELIFTDELEEE